MITTRRSENSEVSFYEQRNVSSGIDLLERKSPETVNRYSVHSVSNDENLEEAKIRMQRNLDKLLHYEEHLNEEKAEECVVETEIAQAQTATVEAQAEEQVQSVVASATIQEDDIRPTSTTMQFGDGEVERVYNDMNKSKEQVKDSYHLNTKGKIVVALYALAVVVILALIVLNTGLIASLKANNLALSAKVEEVAFEYTAAEEELAHISSDDYVENWAIENGLVKQ